MDGRNKGQGAGWLPGGAVGCGVVMEKWSRVAEDSSGLRIGGSCCLGPSKSAAILTRRWGPTDPLNRQRGVYPGAIPTSRGDAAWMPRPPPAAALAEHRQIQAWPGWLSLPSRSRTRARIWKRRSHQQSCNGGSGHRRISKRPVAHTQHRCRHQASHATSGPSRSSRSSSSSSSSSSSTKNQRISTEARPPSVVCLDRDRVCQSQRAADGLSGDVAACQEMRETRYGTPTGGWTASARDRPLFGSQARPDRRLLAPRPRFPPPPSPIRPLCASFRRRSWCCAGTASSLGLSLCSAHGQAA